MCHNVSLYEGRDEDVGAKTPNQFFQEQAKGGELTYNLTYFLYDT